MKKRTSQLLSTLLVLCIVLALLPGMAQGANVSGSCGSNVRWSYSDSTLTIEGTGSMEDYTTYESQPWYGFRNRIHTVRIDNGVTNIGGWAFGWCEYLTSVSIPDGVTTIGDHAFFCCTNLASVTIPDSVTTIENSAFVLCTSLTSVTIPGSVTTIRNNTFEHCTSLTSVTISEGVTTIENSAFYGCTNLTSVTIPSSVTEIGNFPFFQCTALEDLINYPDAALNARIACNKVFVNGWSNPGKSISTQSTRITSVANEITAGLTSDYEKAKAIATWVSKNIKYGKNTTSNDPEAVLDSKLTVCEGYSKLTEALLQAVGIPARYITGTSGAITDRERNTGWRTGFHAWNQAFVDGQWIWMDTTWGMRYFDVGTVYFSLDHAALALPGASTASADDTPSDWAQGEVWEAICQGLVPNDLQAAYRNGMTREEFCRLMITLLEKTTGQGIDAYLASNGLTAQAPFTDTSNTAIAAAYVLGIVNGTSSTTFSPDGSISRQEAATMLARTAKVLELTAKTSESFNDADQFASWASESIEFISGLTDPISGGKVMSGTGKGVFSPLSDYTREQAILTALRLFHCCN